MALDTMRFSKEETMNLLEACQHSGLSAATLMRYVSDNKIPCCRKGGEFIFKKADLDAYKRKTLAERKAARRR
jgi:excisionase family DNA binding protein